MNKKNFIRCKHLPKPPKNGMVIAPKMEHSMKARFKCKDGYELKGDPLISCSFGNWTGEIPRCEEGMSKFFNIFYHYLSQAFRKVQVIITLFNQYNTHISLLIKKCRA